MDMNEEAYDDECSKSTSSLMRALIKELPQGSDPKFVLAHPDFDAQNILVGPDGSVTGVIDWDRAWVKPRFMGNESYPLWLMNDWDVASFIHDEGVDENTHEELVRYRGMYASFIAEAKKEHAKGMKDEVNWPNVSLLATILDYAAMTPDGKADIVLAKILREICIATFDDPRAPWEAQKMEVYLLPYLNGKEADPEKPAMRLQLELGKRIAQGTVTEDEMGWLRDGFAKLCSMQL